MRFKEKFNKRLYICKGKIVDFVIDKIELPDKNLTTREYTIHPGAVTIIPVLDELKTLEKREIIFIKQYRFPVKKLIIELPAGKIEKNESMIKCVRRELVEETGFKARKIKKLISFWPTPAFSTEIIHIYTATDLIHVGNSPDKDEYIEKVIMNFKTAMKLITSGKIKDSKTIIGLMYYKFLNES